MADGKKPSSPIVGESVVGLYNRLRKTGPTLPPEALAIATTSRLVAELLAAIRIWGAASNKVDHVHRRALEEEMRGFTRSLPSLRDCIAQLGGLAPSDPDRDLNEAVDDVAWANHERALRAILAKARKRLLSTCARIEVCQQVPADTQSVVRRLMISLRRIASSSGLPGEHGTT